MVTWPWALGVLAIGFIGGLMAGRALDKFGTGVEVPEGFRYIPQRDTELRVVGGTEFLDGAAHTETVRRHMQQRGIR